MRTIHGKICYWYIYLFLLCLYEPETVQLKFGASYPYCVILFLYALIFFNLFFNKFPDIHHE